MISNKLPSVLQAKNLADSLSMERALKQIRSLLISEVVPRTPEIEDKVNASLDDIQTMIDSIDRV